MRKLPTVIDIHMAQKVSHKFLYFLQIFSGLVFAFASIWVQERKPEDNYAPSVWVLFSALLAIFVTVILFLCLICCVVWMVKKATKWFCFVSSLCHKLRPLLKCYVTGVVQLCYHLVGQSSTTEWSTQQVSLLMIFPISNRRMYHQCDSFYKASL